MRALGIVCRVALIAALSACVALCFATGEADAKGAAGRASVAARAAAKPSPKSLVKPFSSPSPKVRLASDVGFREACSRVSSAPRIGRVDRSNPSLFSGGSVACPHPWWFLAMDDDEDEEEECGNEGY